MQVVENIEEVLVTTDNGKKLAVLAHDGIIGWSLIIGKSWDGANNAIFEKIVKPGDIILELGGNYGYNALRLSDLVGSKGKIYSFEANPITYNLFKFNMEINKATNIISYNYAVFNKKGEIKFNSLDKRLKPIRGQNLGASHIIINDSQDIKGNIITVPTVRIDDILNKVPYVNLIKMDIEGAERPAMEGAIKLIKRSPNLTIISEWIPSLILPFGDIKGFINFYRDMGFRFGAIEGGPCIRELNDNDLLNSEWEVIISKDLDKLGVCGSK
jgi:FkbM family methyltransferase